MSWAGLLSASSRLTAEPKFNSLLRGGKTVAAVGVARLIRQFIDSEGDFSPLDIDQRENTVPDANRIADRKFELLHAPPPAGAQMPVLQAVTVGTLCRDDCCKLSGARGRCPAGQFCACWPRRLTRGGREYNTRESLGKWILIAAARFKP
jgi:hypothetical protein